MILETLFEEDSQTLNNCKYHAMYLSRNWAYPPPDSTTGVSKVSHRQSEAGTGDEVPGLVASQQPTSYQANSPPSESNLEIRIALDNSNQTRYMFKHLQNQIFLLQLAKICPKVN